MFKKLHLSVHEIVPHFIQVVDKVALILNVTDFSLQCQWQNRQLRDILTVNLFELLTNSCSDVKSICLLWIQNQRHSFVNICHSYCKPNEMSQKCAKTTCSLSKKLPKTFLMKEIEKRV